MKNLYVFFIFLAALTLNSTVFAMDQKYESEPKDKFTAKQSKPLKYTSSEYEYNVSNRWGAYVYASLIYWQPREKDLELGELSPTNTATDKFQIETLSTDFDLGFKVGIGAIFRDGWLLNAEYVRLHTSNSQKVTLPSWASGFTDYWTTVVTDSEFYLCWKLDYDILTLDISRSSYIGEWFIFQIIGGLKGGWIDQKINTYAIDSSNSNRFNADYKLNSWLIGPKVGFTTKFLLCETFRFFTNLNFSLLYQDFNNKASIDRNDGSGSNTIAQDTSYIVPNIDTAIGFGWRKAFQNDAWIIDLSASYDINYYFSQQQLRRLVTKEFASDIGALALQGLTLTAKIEF
ncbi:MAG: hypothetical protein K940chlam8_00795 [Chlamydiae bacterium]|nr:hypothetical protein [Chlamydiota bacterium]